MSDVSHPLPERLLSRSASPVVAARRSGDRGRRRAVMVAGLVVALFAGGWLAFTGYTVAQHGQSLLQTAAALRTMVSSAGPAAGGDLAALTARLPEVGALVETMVGDLRMLRDSTAPIHPVLERLGWLPGYGPEIAAAPHLLGLVLAGAEAGRHALRALAGVPEAVQRDGLAGLTAALGQGQRELLAAEAALRRAQQERREIPPGDLRHPEVLRLLNQSDALLPPLLASVRAALVLPDLLGNDEAQTYLIIGQNNDELRATGGFIGTAGLLTVQQGQIVSFDYGDSYKFDASEPRPLIAPPRPLVDYMLIADWRLRDANWWADFPTSARKLEAFLRTDQGSEVAGVIALDQTVLQELMGHLGPVEVPTFGERVDAANLLELLDRYAHPSGYKEGYVAPDPPKVTGADRKAFLGELARILLARGQRLDPGMAVPLLQTVRRLLDEKHLLLYLHHPEAADLLRRQGWDGALPQVAGDTLLLVETNVGYSKANRTVEQRLDYRVEVLDDLSVGRSVLTLTYRNTNAAPARHCAAAVVDFYTADDSCYKSYVRVYVPPGSALVEMQGFDGTPESFTEGPRTVFANLLVLQPGETRRATVTYVPPRGVITRTAESGLWIANFGNGALKSAIRNPQSAFVYRLAAAKQPGTGAIPLTVTVVPPHGYQPLPSIEGLPGSSRVAEHRETDLARDRDLAIEFQRSP